MTSDLNISRGIMSDFLSFPWFGCILLRKLQNFSLKVIEILKFFDKKNDVIFEYVLSTVVSSKFVPVYFVLKLKMFQ